MVTHIDIELERVKKERDDYRAAIVEFLTQIGKPNDSVLIAALGKKRLKR